MGNTFKSLIAAAGILAAGDATNAQEGADSTANKTKQALVELLSELPPGFDSARKVIEGDITLAGDGDLSEADELKIDSDMGKLATTVVAEKARKVREAMNGVETIVAADQVAALNESPEERKIREDEEKRQLLRVKIVEETNKLIEDEKKWSSLKAGTAKNDVAPEINETKGALVFSIPRTKTRGQAVLSQKLLKGPYNIELDASDGEIGIFWKSGNEYKSVYLKPGINSFELEDDTKIDFCVFPDVANPEIVIRRLKISDGSKIVIASE